MKTGSLFIAALALVLLGLGLRWGLTRTQVDTRRAASVTKAAPEPAPQLRSEDLRAVSQPEEEAQQTVTRTSVVAEPASEFSVRVQTHMAGMPRMPLSSIEFGFGKRGSHLLGHPPIYRGRTDVNGVAEIEVPPEWLAANLEIDASTNDAALVAWVSQRDKTEAARLIRRDKEGRFYVELGPRSGRTVHGRVVNEDGTAVSGARVSVTSIAYAGNSKAPTSNHDGLFRLDVLWSRVSVISARSDEWGSGQIWLNGRRDEHIPFCEIVVGGEGALRGQIVHPNGAPVVGIRVQVEHARRAQITQQGLGVHDALSDYAREELGTTLYTCTTDKRGRFEARGLRHGDYNLTAWRHGTLEKHFSLSQTPVPANGVEQEYTIVAPQLFLRVTKPGSPEFDATISARLGNRRSLKWPDRLSITVQSLDSVRTVSRWNSTERSEVPSSKIDGRFIFDVRPGETYVVTAFGGDFAPTSRTIEVAETSGRIDLELVLSDSELAGHGTVEFNPRLPLGATGSLPIQLRLRELETSALLWRGEGSFDADGFVSPAAAPIKIPAGRYRVMLSGRRDMRRLASYHSSLPNDPDQDFTSRTIGEWSGEITVSPGATTVVAPTLSAGARLRILWITSPAQNADLDELEVYFELHARGRVVERVLFEHELRPDTPGLAFGVDSTSGVVSPGSFTLIVSHGNGRTSEHAVELRAGETTTVRLRTKPRTDQ